MTSRVLIVEDDPDIARVLQDDLMLDGHEVVAVGNGRSALETARDQRFDLIILDVMLPGLDGFEVCRQLRRDDIGTPILFLTAKGEELEKLFGFELGADDYVTKPFSPRELRARAKALMRRSNGVVDRLTFGQVQVDFERSELTVAGRAVPMTASELKILRLLAASKGRILSRTQLIETLWGPGANVTDRAIDAHIVNLRRKIEPDPAHPSFLKSVRGLGYRLNLGD